jgi:hypothetical protein
VALVTGLLFSAALTVLQSATTSAFARTTEGTFEAPTNTKFVGTLNGAMRVFVDSYAADTTPVLVGYKGTSEADAAAFYCPYIPLMSFWCCTGSNNIRTSRVIHDTLWLHRVDQHCKQLR